MGADEVRLRADFARREARSSLDVDRDPLESRRSGLLELGLHEVLEEGNRFGGVVERTLDVDVPPELRGDLLEVGGGVLDGTGNPFGLDIAGPTDAFLTSFWMRTLA